MNSDMFHKYFYRLYWQCFVLMFFKVDSYFVMAVYLFFFVDSCWLGQGEGHIWLWWNPVWVSFSFEDGWTSITIFITSLNKNLMSYQVLCYLSSAIILQFWWCWRNRIIWLWDGEFMQIYKNGVFLPPYALNL